MDHLLFDALKISPIPMETANKATATGWMLEIEKILNDILSKSEERYGDLALDTKEKIDALQKEIISSIKEMESYPKTDSYANMIFEKLKHRIENLFSELIGGSLSYITFGLEDGYFVAYVPDTYDSISFETELNPESDDYGKLQVNY